MPKKLVAVAPGRAALVDYEESAVGRNEVKVRVEYASPKHGSEVGIFRGEDPFVADLFDEDWRLFMERKDRILGAGNGEGLALGNQWVGVVVEKGKDVRRFRVGDRVCGYGSIRETQVIDAVNDPIPPRGARNYAVEERAVPGPRTVCPRRRPRRSRAPRRPRRRVRTRCDRSHRRPDGESSRCRLRRGHRPHREAQERRRRGGRRRCVRSAAPGRRARTEESYGTGLEST